MTVPHPVQTLINDLGGPTRLARRLSNLDREGKRFPESTISAWKHRNSIPAWYWRRILDVAKHYDIAGVTEKALIAAHRDLPPERSDRADRCRTIGEAAAAA